MTEEPKQMLPQQRAAAITRIERVTAQMAIDEEQEQVRGQRRKGHEDQQRRRDHLPSEDADRPSPANRPQIKVPAQMKVRPTGKWERLLLRSDELLVR